MGIHIRKMLGYGLIDLVTDDRGRITDPRINTDSPFLNGGLDERHTVDAYLAYLEATDPEVDDTAPAADRLTTLRARTGLERRLIRHYLENGQGRSVDPEDAVVHRSEYGLPNVLCLRPVSQPGWTRRSDDIDWVMDSYVVDPSHSPANGFRDGRDYVQLLPASPYPYGGLYMDDRTGERVDSIILSWVRETSRLPAAPSDRAGGFDSSVLDDLAREGGFADHADALTHCVPLLPGEVRRLAAFADLFTDPAVANQLRPMLYTYWA